MKEENRLVIILSLYNSNDTIERCLGSIMSQSYRNFKCFIVDDNSSDASLELVEEFLMDEDDNRYVVIKNDTRQYTAGILDNICVVRPEVNDEDIIVEMNGDDWLASRNVFQHIVDAYNDGAWITNGSTKPAKGDILINWKPVEDLSLLRKGEYPMTALRTWKSFLWRSMDASALKDPDGDYWSIAAELFYMYDMIEMATLDRYRFIREATNVASGNSDYTYEQRLPYINMVNTLANRRKPRQPLLRVV